MKQLLNLDFMGISRIFNLPMPLTDNEAASRAYVLAEIQKALSGLDYQADVLGVQTDNTLNPTATPTNGSRYLLKNVSNLNANFGNIAGLENGDIVAYNGSVFTVVYDVSAKGDGVLVYNQGDNLWYHYAGGTWSAGGLSDITAGTGLKNTSGTINVLFDGVTIGIDVNGKLYVMDKSISKGKLAADVAGYGLIQDDDGSLKIKLADSSLTLDPTNGLKVTKTILGKAVADLGDGSLTEFTIAHTLNTEDVVAMVRSNSNPKATIDCEITIIDSAHVKFTFTSVPAVNEFRAVIIG